MKFIIFYNECLRSKIIYSRFIRNNKKDIKYVFRLPINLSSKNKFFLLKKGIFNNNAYSYIVFQLFQTFFYNIFSKLFFCSIESLCKRENINFSSLENFPEIGYIKKKIKNYKKNDIIFVSTTYILNHKNLSIKNPILNLHEADPDQYKGSAIYFQLAKDKRNYMKTVIMEPTTKIDSGRVLLSSKFKKIKNFSVFKIILTGYKLQDILMSKIKKINIKKKISKN